MNKGPQDRDEVIAWYQAGLDVGDPASIDAELAADGIDEPSAVEVLGNAQLVEEFWTYLRGPGQ